MAHDVAKAIYAEATAGEPATLFLVIESQTMDAELLQLEVYPTYLLITEFPGGRCRDFCPDPFKLLWLTDPENSQSPTDPYIAHRYKIPQTERALTAHIRKWDDSAHSPRRTFEYSSPYTLTLFSKSHCGLARHSSGTDSFCISLQATKFVRDKLAIAVRRSEASDRSDLRLKLADMFTTACTYDGSCDEGAGVPLESGRVEELWY